MSDNQTIVEPSNIEKLREIGDHLIDPSVAVKIFEEIPDALIVVNALSQIKFVNKQAELLFHYTRGEMYEKPFELLVDLGSLKTFFAAPTARQFSASLKAQNRVGVEFFVQVDLAPIVVPEGLLTLAIVKAL